MVDSEDEDVLFDNDHGRTLIGGKEVKNIDDVLNGGHRDKRKLRKTLALCLAFLCLGLCTAVIGPTLLSLKEHFATILPKASLVFTGRSVGYLLGAILGGILIERFNALLLIGTTLLLCGCGFVAAPYLTSLLVFGIAISTVGICMGVLDTGANLVCIRMWGTRRSATMLQALHFSFAFGAFLAPILVAPFLAETLSNHTMVASTSPTQRRLLHIHANILFVSAHEDEEATGGLDSDILRNISQNVGIRHPRAPSEHEESGKGKPKDTSPETPSSALLATTQATILHTPSKSTSHAVKATTGNSMVSLSPSISILPVASSSAATKATILHTPSKSTSHAVKAMTGNSMVSLSPSISILPVASSSAATKETILPPLNQSTSHAVMATTGNSMLSLSPSNSILPVASSTATKETTSPTPSKSTSHTPKAITATTSSAPVKSGPQRQVERFLMAYLIIGVFTVFSSLLFFYFFLTKPKHEPSHFTQEIQENKRNQNNCTFRTRILALLFIFYFLYVGGEVTYGGFVAAFAVESRLQFDQDDAAHVVSLFWGMFTLGRGLAICLASVISPLKMVLCDLVGCIATSAVLSVYAEQNVMAFWAGTAFLGLFMASLFPSGIAWLQTYTEVTGNAASFLVVGSALGEMGVPLLISLLFRSYMGPTSLMYIMLIISTLSALIFFYVMRLAAETGQEKESVPTDKSPALDLFDGIKEALPLEDISIQNGGAKNGKQMTKQLIPPKLKRKNHKE